MEQDYGIQKNTGHTQLKALYQLFLIPHTTRLKTAQSKCESIGRYDLPQSFSLGSGYVNLVTFTDS
jgi:hypothetical protein